MKWNINWQEERFGDCHKNAIKHFVQVKRPQNALPCNKPHHKDSRHVARTMEYNEKDKKIVTIRFLAQQIEFNKYKVKSYVCCHLYERFQGPRWCKVGFMYMRAKIVAKERTNKENNKRQTQIKLHFQFWFIQHFESNIELFNCKVSGTSNNICHI